MAQDYRLFFKERNTFFEGAKRAFHLDSIEFVNGQERWHNFEASTICRSEDYFNDTTMIWLLEAFDFDDSTGTYHFLNEDLDTIRVQSKASLGERWVLYQYPDSSYIEATVSALKHELLLGVEDSVKEAKLQVFSLNGDSLSNEWNTTSIRWSKSLGIVQFFNLHFFPREIQPMTIIGLSNPRIGFAGLTDTDFGDLEVGTEWHTLSNWHGRYQEINTLRSFEVVSIEGNDQYMVRRRTGRSNYQDPDGGEESIDTTYNDTIILMDLPAPRLSEEELPFREVGDGFVTYFYIESWGRWQKKLQYSTFPNRSYRPNPDWDCVPWSPNQEEIWKNYLIEGLPILFSAQKGGMGQHVHAGDMRILYFKDEKGEFGKEINFQPFIDYNTFVPDSVELFDGAAIFPNPVQDRLKFWVNPQQYEGPIQIDIYNMYGQLVRTQVAEIETPIFLDKLAFGIYQVFLIHDGQVIFQDKFKKL